MIMHINKVACIVPCIVACIVPCIVACIVAEELGISSATTSQNTTKLPFPTLVAYESAISSATTHLPLSRTGT